MEETTFSTAKSIQKRSSIQEVPKLIVTNDVDPAPVNVNSTQEKSLCASNWRFFVTILVPLVIAPLLVMRDADDDDGKKFKCTYVVILMIVSWMLQLLPIGVTSLLPLLLFPILGVLDSAQVSKNYVKETTVLFVGGLIIALAVEYCNVHRRIALGVMKSVGCSPSRLTFGTMLTTAFLSMWINNTATAGLTIPIVSATVDEIFEAGKGRSRERKRSAFRALSTPDLASAEAINFFKQSPTPLPEEMRKKNLKKMLLLSVCLAANIGGTAVITGSASNLIFHQQSKSLNIGQDGKYRTITFAFWILYNFPPVVVNLLVCWFYLVVYFNGVPEWISRHWKQSTEGQICQRKEEAERQKQVELLLAEKYKNLGSISFHEGAVLFLFISTILLWFFRDPGFMTGWAPYFPNVKDSTVAVLAVFFFFIIPRLPGASATLLEWKYVQDSLPWGLVILLGGGFAMSDGIVRSGLSVWLGSKLMHLSALPNSLLLFVVMIFTVVCTSVTSNAATASTLLALLTPLSKSLNLHPLFLTLPTTVTCSYAFLLPISTPPNALVHQAAGEDLSVGEMVKVMLFPNVCCLIILFLFHISYGNLIFNFNDYIYQHDVNGTHI